MIGGDGREGGASSMPYPFDSSFLICRALDQDTVSTVTTTVHIVLYIVYPMESIYSTVGNTGKRSAPATAV